MATVADFDAVMDPLHKLDGPGAAVAVQQNGRVIYAAGYGLANVELNVPISTKTVFRVASITKQFTAAAIMRLVDLGKLMLDDPIERFLPALSVNGRLITVHHLLNHTSGMARDLGDTVSEIVNVFKDRAPDSQPGERFRYSNSGYILLGAVIEACSGKDYEDFLSGELFAPLGLANTCYLTNERLVPMRASGYAQVPTGLRNASSRSTTWPDAAGALGSTVEDLLTWDRALHGGEVLSPPSYSAMITPGRRNDWSSMTYGYGLRTFNYRGHAAIGHRGGLYGFQASLMRWPEADLTIVVLSNNSGFPISTASYGLARRALGWPDLQRAEVELTEGELAAAAGTYFFDAGPLELKATDRGLTSVYRTPVNVYRPFGKDRFFLDRDSEIALSFEDLDNGVYQRVIHDTYGTRAVGKRMPPSRAGQ